MSLDYDVLKMPPPIMEEMPQWMLNFMSSDKELAEPNLPVSPPGFPEFSPLDALGALSPLLATPEPLPPPMPELSWDYYFAIAGLEEIEPLSDEEELPQTPPPEQLTPTTSATLSAPSISSLEDKGTVSSAEPESSIEYQIHRRNWINKEKVQGNGACPGENIDHMLTIIPEYFEPKSIFSSFHQEFALPNHLWTKWKDGVRLWPTTRFSKTRIATRDDQVTAEILKRLLDAKVIETTVAGPYVSSFFYLIDRNGSKLRPIFNI